MSKEDKSKITELLAWVIVAPDGTDGVPAIQMPNGTVFPLMGADMPRSDLLKQYAQEVANRSQKPIKLYRSTSLEIIDTLEPEPREWINADSENVPERNRDALNQTYEGDGSFFISYLGSVSEAEEKFELTKKKKFVRSDQETALIRRGTGPLGMHEYFELPGDYREGYQKIIDAGGDFDECYKFYQEQGGTK